MVRYVAGVDLGGTKIYTALADSRGVILAALKTPTPAGRPADEVIGKIAATLDQVINTCGGIRPEVIAVGAPGPLDPERGVVYNSPNLGWQRVPLKRKLEELTGVTVCVDNDANLAALGEYCHGAGQGSRCMVYVTVSTGIGGGIILDGKLYRGSGSSAGEVGHMVVDPDGPRCSCGRPGCLEALASGTAIARRGRELVQAGRGIAILAGAQGDPGRITAEIVCEAAEGGDPEAEEIISRAGEYLGMGLAGVVNLINPDRLVIGGGAMKAGRLLWDAMTGSLQERALDTALADLQVVKAGLDGKSGLMGAITMASLYCGAV